MTPCRYVKLSLSLTLVLFALGITKPGELIGGTLILVNLLLIDRFAFGAHPAFDDSAFLLSVVVAHFVSRLREAGNMPPDLAGRLPALLLQLVWAVLGALICAHSRFPSDSRGSRWVPTFLAFGCAAFALATPCDVEPYSRFLARACLYFLLALMLHVGRDFGTECIVGSRGFLLCFYPVMFVAWPLAWVFALGALLVLIHMDHEDTLLAAADGGERELYHIVQVAPSDPI
jgi:hypothetical protein